MKVRRIIPALILCFVLCFAGCSREKIIPKKTFKKIYAEIFIADQIISEEYNNSRRFLDTTLVYEGIFNKYGYTTKDYQATLEQYMSDPILFTRVIKASGRIIDARLKDAQAELKAYEEEFKRQQSLEQQLEAMRLFAPEKYYFLVGLDDTSAVFAICDTIKVFVDSTGRGSWAFDPQKGRDTVFKGPMIVVDTLRTAASDSLAVSTMPQPEEEEEYQDLPARDDGLEKPAETKPTGKPTEPLVRKTEIPKNLKQNDAVGQFKLVEE